jgi:uncharacterized protein YndB with AHSA1/START domain
MPNDGQSVATTGSYQARIRVKATPDDVFESITSTVALAAWWVPHVTGSGNEGGQLQFHMGPPDPLIVQVDVATRPALVEWTVTDCSFEPGWVGTQPRFVVTAIDETTTELQFEHRGLTPALECHDFCCRSWNHFVEKSLRDYLEVGEGSPRGSAADEAWRAKLGVNG